MEPDNTSVASITRAQQNYLLIGNDFSDASIAIQFYGISIGHIAAESTSARAGGFHLMGKEYFGVQPSWYCQFLDNTITEGNGMTGPWNNVPPVESHISAWGRETLRGKVIVEMTWPMARCAVIRGNRLQNNAHLELRGTLSDAVVENNTVENADLGLRVEEKVKWAVIRANRFVNVRKPYEGPHPSE